MAILENADDCNELDGSGISNAGAPPVRLTYGQIEVEFKIHGQGHLHGDGMAIWMTEERGQPGQVFGHRDNFNGLGVFIDTYKNQRPGVVFPYVMAMMGDGQTPYDQEHDGKANELAGCSVRLFLRC